jgi:hypothetical protein
MPSKRRTACLSDMALSVCDVDTTLTASTASGQDGSASMRLTSALAHPIDLRPDRVLSEDRRYLPSRQA